MSQQKQTLSLPEARRLAIAHQGLHTAAPFGRGKQGVLAAIDHLGYVQIDTISVTERAHHHVLWSRVPQYKQAHLDMLQKEDKQIMEYWAHAAAYLPMRDYRYALPTMDHFRNHRDQWPKAERKAMEQVLARIREEGPLKSRDFGAPQKNTTGWWDWKPAKVALQRLFFSGEIMVSHREGFQRVYDLPERILPPHINTSTPSADEYGRYLILHTLRAHGIARASEMAYLRKGMGAPVRRQLELLGDAGDIQPVHVRGVDGTFYIATDALNNTRRITKRVRLLSPFDNAVIQRGRLRDLFAFDYLIECYVPKPKRIYGYYCLPILYGDRFLGRVDAKADRRTRTLHIIHLIMEQERMPEDVPVKLAQAVMKFAAFNGCDTVRVERATPGGWKRRLQEGLAGIG